MFPFCALYWSKTTSSRQVFFTNIWPFQNLSIPCVPTSDLPFLRWLLCHGQIIGILTKMILFLRMTDRWASKWFKSLNHTQKHSHAENKHCLSAIGLLSVLMQSFLEIVSFFSSWPCLLSPVNWKWLKPKLQRWLISCVGQKAWKHSFF